MRQAIVILCCWIGSSGLTRAETIDLDGRRFSLPDGFSIECVAGPPLVERPITAAFDEWGRLYVAESSGSNDPVQVQLQEKPHRILRLEDHDGDGEFDHRTIFADRMMFPEGTLWTNGSLYVSAPPEIWKLTDEDQDGIAEHREVWFDGKTLTGCANDLHGPYEGLDGWIYWCKGAFAAQSYERDGGEPWVTKAAHIFRRRLDGTGPIEPVMTGGMDNPVDVVFTPGGERIFSTTFLQYPAGGFRDGLIHALYGGLYGKTHGVLEGHPRTQPGVLPPLTHLGPAAPAGLECYQSTAFGVEFLNNLFACQFNLRTVSRHQVVQDRASFRTIDAPFLRVEDTDFHPTDVLEDADGSLLVVDTGGWYKLCCPTSQLWKPDLPGAIYRIRRKDHPRVEDPRGLKLDWENLDNDRLADLLDDPRPAVRSRSLKVLAGRGELALESLLDVLHESESAEARRNAIWASCRIDDAQARSLGRIGLADRSETVRQAALHVVSVQRDRGALEEVRRILREGTPQNRRAAAEALGRLNDPSVVPDLLDAVRSLSSEDWALLHSLTYALIELGAPTPTRLGLKSEESEVQRVTLIALDQIAGDHLDADEVVPRLSDSDPRLQEAVAWIASRHPEWGEDLAHYYRSQIKDIGDQSPDQRVLLMNQLRGLESSSAIADLIAEVLCDSGVDSKPARILALEVIARTDLDPAPDSWIKAVAQLIGESDVDLSHRAVAAAQALRGSNEQLSVLQSPLTLQAQNRALPVSTRLDALVALPGGLTDVDPALFTFLLDLTTSDQSATDQTRA